MGNSGLIKGLSPNEIAIKAKKSFDKYLSSIKMSTGKSSTLEDYLNMLKLLAEAKFWAIKYFLVETSVSERFRIDFKLKKYYHFDPSLFTTHRSALVMDPTSGTKRTKKVILIMAKCQTLTLLQRYERIHRRLERYSIFLKENPESGKQPVKLAREKLKVSKIKKEDPSVQIVPQPVDLSTINFTNLIDFILLCIDFEKPYARLLPEEASQKVETDTNNIRNLLCLTIVTMLSSTFTKRNRCEIADNAFMHVIVSVKYNRNLSRCEMSRTKVCYDNTNCTDCRGCNHINTVSKYGDTFIFSTGIESILIFTCLGEYNSFFAFVMFLCKINHQFSPKTNTPENFQEIKKLLNVIFGLHFHYLPDLDVLINTYNVNYDRRHVLSKSYTASDLMLQLNVSKEHFDVLEDLKNLHDSKASERKHKSRLRKNYVEKGRTVDEEKTGLSWKDPRVFHVRTGGKL